MTIHAQIQGTTAADAPPELAENHFRAALTALEATRAETAQGWTPQRQAQFLAAIADGATVQDAAGEVGQSRRSAYALRHRAGREAFALGWQAAEVLARYALRETLWDRAQNGQSWTTVRDDGERIITTTRHRHDNRLALAMLTKLEARVADGGRAVRLGDQFDDFLALVERDAAPADPVALFAALAPPAPANHIGNGESCESAEDEADDPVLWFDDHCEEWFTTLPPPLDFDGETHGSRREGDYFRELIEEEVASIAHFDPDACVLPLHPLEQAAQAKREAWFAAARLATCPRDVALILNPLPLAGGKESPDSARVASGRASPEQKASTEAHPPTD